MEVPMRFMSEKGHVLLFVRTKTGGSLLVCQMELKTKANNAPLPGNNSRKQRGEVW